jgi:hypothetical protein
LSSSAGEVVPSTSRLAFVVRGASYPNCALAQHSFFIRAQIARLRGASRAQSRRTWIKSITGYRALLI